MDNWEKVESFVATKLKLKKTKRSGASNQDGDLKDAFLMAEVKDQNQLSIDHWWWKIRQEASENERVPILVVARPPEKVGLPSESGTQYLVVIDLNDFEYYYSKWKEEYA